MLKLKHILAVLLLMGAAGQVSAQSWQSLSTSDNSTVRARHETGSVAHANMLYVFGGRGNRPVEAFNADTKKWSQIATMPKEMHHFQPVVVNNKIYIIGAMTCCYPAEENVNEIYRLNLANNEWEIAGNIPDNRARGGAAAVVRNDKIYLLGGNTNGHSGGYVNWFDEYDPATDTWTELSDAPNARDHFSAALVGNKLISVGGRRTNKNFSDTVAQTDTYNFNTNSWGTAPSIPTPRAGAMLGISNGNVIVIGGESGTTNVAHDEVEAFNVAQNKWRSLPNLLEGRHGGAGGVINDTLHVVTGNLTRGGGNETTSHETLDLSDSDNDGEFDFEDSTSTPPPNANSDDDNDGLDLATEQQLGTDPSNNDSDNDNVDDGDEVNEHNTDPLNNDSDNDSLTDGQEINQHNTDPLAWDSDNDGLSDSEEIDAHTNPNKPDSDNDGLSDIDELQTYGTNPNNSDSDADSLPDADELNIYQTNPQQADSDSDGLDDSAEVLTYNTDPNNWDTDLDGVSDATEVAEGTRPAVQDQDGDGILNSAEGTADADGDSYPNYIDLDSDNDGIPDLVENGRIDSNNDGMLDTADAELTGELFDADNDGIANIFDLDSDQDGITDLAETGYADPENNGRIETAVFATAETAGWYNTALHPLLDSDNDATADYLDLDSDDNGVSDLVGLGHTDENDDGMLDMFVDTNLDGLQDELTGITRSTGPDSMNIDTGRSSGGGSLISLMLPILLIWRRYRTILSTSKSR